MEVVGEIVELRRLGHRFIAASPTTNSYPVSLGRSGMARAAARSEPTASTGRHASVASAEVCDGGSLLNCRTTWSSSREITMEAAEDTAFLDAMRKARIRVFCRACEAVTLEGLKDVYKGFNLAGDARRAPAHVQAARASHPGRSSRLPGS